MFIKVKEHALSRLAGSKGALADRAERRLVEYSDGSSVLSRDRRDRSGRDEGAVALPHSLVVVFRTCVRALVLAVVSRIHTCAI